MIYFQPFTTFGYKNLKNLDNQQKRAWFPDVQTNAGKPVALSIQVLDFEILF